VISIQKNTVNVITLFDYQLQYVPAATNFLLFFEKQGETFNKVTYVPNTALTSTSYYKLILNETDANNEILSAGTVNLMRGHYNLYLFSAATGVYDFNYSASTFLYQEELEVLPIEVDDNIYASNTSNFFIPASSQNFFFLTNVQNGINTFTGGTALNPSVNVTGLSIDNIYVSGSSQFVTISAGTIYSGGTDLSLLFAPIGSTGSGNETHVQNGLNTYTGGTALLPTVNISSATLSNLSVSGSASFNVLSASTFVSGSTLLSTIIYNSISKQIGVYALSERISCLNLFHQK